MVSRGMNQTGKACMRNSWLVLHLRTPAGFYTYFASDAVSYGADPRNWAGLSSWAQQHGKLFIASVGPGYDDTRIRPWNAAATRPRQGGAVYRRSWDAALAVQPWAVSITSYNEWGEGTQIEPARVFGDTSGSSSSSGGGAEEPAYEYKPFSRLRERNPYRLLGVSKDASFEEIQDARNYLWEQYKWHEPSREAIEMAFDRLLQKHMGERFKFGFRPPRTGRRSDIIVDRRSTLWDGVVALFDPTVTARTLVNEGAVFGAFALWVLFSSDQSFPLAAAFAYSVYQFQSKRVKRNPEGPFLGGNAIVGAILSTLACLAVACAVMAVLTTPLTAVLGQSSRQVGGFITIAVLGAVGIYLK